MKLYFARHGQTEWNAQNRICSRADIPLSAAGIAQARELSAQIAERGDVDLLVASPMIRAKQTAAIIAEAIDKPIFFDTRLKEWDFGKYEGAQREEFNEALRMFRGNEFALPLGETGETLLQLTHRVYSALDDIKVTHAGKTVFVIAHGGVCRVIETYFRPMAAAAFADFRIGNCEWRYGEF